MAKCPSCEKKGEMRNEYMNTKQWSEVDNELSRTAVSYKPVRILGFDADTWPLPGADAVGRPDRCGHLHQDAPAAGAVKTQKNVSGDLGSCRESVGDRICPLPKLSGPCPTEFVRRHPTGGKAIFFYSKQATTIPPPNSIITISPAATPLSPQGFTLPAESFLTSDSSDETPRDGAVYHPEATCVVASVSLWISGEVAGEGVFSVCVLHTSCISQLYFFGFNYDKSYTNNHHR